MRTFSTWLLGVATALVAPSLAADAGPPVPRGWVLTFGANGGYSMHPERANGAVLGAEVSAPYLASSGLWFGAYADALHDFGPRRQRLSFGPELGFAVFGVDGGPLLELADGATRTGFTLRGVLTLGVLGLYGRYGYLDGADPERGFGEIGLLIKAFTPLSEQPRRGAPPRDREPTRPGATDAP